MMASGEVGSVMVLVLALCAQLPLVLVPVAVCFV